MSSRGKKKAPIKKKTYLDGVKKASSIEKKVELIGEHIVGKCFPKTKFHYHSDSFQLKADDSVIWIPTLIPNSQYFWFFRKHADNQIDKRSKHFIKTIKTLRDKIDGVKTKSQLDKLIKNSLPELRKEYKVHLQPLPEKLEHVVCMLLTMKNTPVTMFKVLADFDQAVTDNMPMIACYFDYTDDVAERVGEFIHTLKESLAGIDKPENSIGMVPRFNTKISNSSMIYLAQSSGDLKEDIIKLLLDKGWKNTYFSDDYVLFK